MADSFIPKTVVSKNMIPLCILEILKRHSDFDHKLTQKDIIQYLKDEYGVEIIERKAVGRTIERMREELEISIESNRQGVWLDERELEDSEIRMLIDAVFTSRYITEKYTKELVNKLCNLSSENFKSHVKYTYTMEGLDKTDNPGLFLNMELVDLAIDTGRQLEFDYNKYRTSKKLTRITRNTVSPYRLIVHNQRYYLMALNEAKQEISYYRLDHITNMMIRDDLAATPVRRVPGWENGITNKNMATGMPFLFSDKPERITFYADPRVLDSMIDWLGYDIEIITDAERQDYEKDPAPEKHNINLRTYLGVGSRMKITVKTSPTAMKYFALQYLDEVEILQPQTLREDIYKTITKAERKYR